MKYRSLGCSNLKVSEIGLGCNTFGWAIDEKASIAVIGRALDLGINFIDTADMYDQGRSEEFVGRALEDRRSQVILATKFGYPMGDDPRDRGGSRSYILRAVEASLRRLQTDYIDLYQFHLPDPDTPIEETLRALDSLVRSGKVRQIGCSRFSAAQLQEAASVSSANALAPFVTTQSRYNLIDRRIERELVPVCRENGVGVIPWGPLAGGFLTGKYSREEQAPSEMRLGRQSPLNNAYRDARTEENWSTLERLTGYAGARGHTVGELAIAWLLARSWVSTVIAGARTVEQVSANVAAAEWVLTEQEGEEVDALAPIE